MKIKKIKPLELPNILNNPYPVNDATSLLKVTWKKYLDDSFLVDKCIVGKNTNNFQIFKNNPDTEIVAIKDIFRDVFNSLGYSIKLSELSKHINNNSSIKSVGGFEEKGLFIKNNELCDNNGNKYKITIFYTHTYIRKELDNIIKNKDYEEIMRINRPCILEYRANNKSIFMTLMKISFMFEKINK